MDFFSEHRKYPYIIFIIVFLITIFIAAYTLAENPDKLIDTDQDGLNDYEEKAIYQTFWYDADTDDDGYDDGLEVRSGYSPKQPKLKMIEADTDADGLNDAWEIKLGTNLMVQDTDGDGYSDGDEVYNGYSPTDKNPQKVEKLIAVDIATFRLEYFFNSILMDSFLVSTGKPSTPTPRGEFTILDKVPVKNYTNLPNTKWNLHFTTGKNKLRYFIHGAYWHNLFGKKNVSGGCVNVPYAYMERLYNWANVGTKVIIK